jgi:hypothetical protein
VLSARLPGGGPRVRLADVRDRRVAIIEAPAADVLAVDQWLAAHRLRPQADIEDGLLVVAVGRDVEYRELLDLVADLRARL